MLLRGARVSGVVAAARGVSVVCNFVLVIPDVRPVYHNAGVNGGRELREFVDEHDDEALEMRLFVRFDTAGGAHFPEVRMPLQRGSPLRRLGTRSAGPEEDGEKPSTVVIERIVEGCSAVLVPRLFEKSTCVHVRTTRDQKSNTFCLVAFSNIRPRE